MYFMYICVAVLKNHVYLLRPGVIYDDTTPDRI